MAKRDQASAHSAQAREALQEILRDEWEADMLRIRNRKVRWIGADILLSHVRIGGR